MGFQDLPAELRNRIYEYALYHHENDGYIAPLATLIDNARVTKCRAIFEGKEQIITLGHGVMKSLPRSAWQVPELSLRACIARKTNVTHHVGACDIASHTEHIYRIVGFPRTGDTAIVTTPFGCRCPCCCETRWAHVCVKKCLVQPPITRTCRSIRQESLPIFYSINKIHFMLSDMSWSKSSSLAQPWWRSIGDTNLAMITDFAVRVLPSTGPVRNLREGYGTTELYFNKTPQRKQVRLTSDFVTKSLAEWSYQVDAEIYPWIHEGFKKKLQYAVMIEEGGLFVKGLEAALGLRAPRKIHPVVKKRAWDDSMLSCDQALQPEWTREPSGRGYRLVRLER